MIAKMQDFQSINTPSNGSSNPAATNATGDQETAPSKGTTQIMLDSAESTVSSLESDASRMNSWVTNAKLAIDVANKSFVEAGKLAHRVEKTAQHSIEKTNVIKKNGATFQDKHITKTKQDTDGDEVVLNRDDVEKLQLRALQVQTLVDESRNQLKDLRFTVVDKTKLIASGMQEQAVCLSRHLDVATLAAESKEAKNHHSKTSSAEDILKGTTPPEIDPECLNKIDGVANVQKNQSDLDEVVYHDDRSSLDTNAAQCRPRSPSSTIAPPPQDSLEENEKLLPQTPVDACDLLKKEDAVAVDPLSMDKIDGLLKRTKHSDDMAKEHAAGPHL